MKNDTENLMEVADKLYDLVGIPAYNDNETHYDMQKTHYEAYTFLQDNQCTLVEALHALAFMRRQRERQNGKR